METLIAILEKNILLGILVLLVVVPVYYKIGLLNWITGKGNGEAKDKTGDNKDLSSQMSRLAQHYNHDTTTLLQKILDNQRETQNTLRNFEQFGIKIRKE